VTTATRTKVLASIPAVVMVTVAAVQLRLVEQAQLSPWKGGGFGMFATTDGGPNRRVRMYMVRDGLEQPVKPASPALRKLAEQAGTLPTPSMLERLAKAMGAQARAEHHEVERVRVEVWRRTFARTLASEQVLLTQATVELDEDDVE
jgi:hypothetical protein